MLKALLWKEWREQRPLLLAGLGVAAALPLLLLATTAALQPGTRTGRVAEIVPVIFALFLWPFFALAAGSSSFAGETGGDRLGFLLSRPVRRRSVWLVKVATRAVSTGLLIAGSLAIAGGGMWLAGIPSRSESALASLARSLSAPERAALGPPALYLLFAAAVFFSAGRCRAWAAAALALGGSALIFTGVLATRPLVALGEDFLPFWTGGLFALAATLLLLWSSRRFRIEPCRGARGIARTAGAFLAIVGVTVAGGFTPAIWADLFADLDRSVAQEIAVGPGGEPVVVGTSVYPLPLGPLWRVDATTPVPGGAGGPGARLTRGLTFNPFLAPDGAWVYYFALPTLPGLARDGVDLRAVRPDGTEDRRVAANVADLPQDARLADVRLYQRFDSILPSPGGSRVLLGYGWWGGPMAIGLEDGEIELLGAERFLGAEETAGRLTVDALGWLADDEIVVHLGRWRSDVHRILAHRIDTGQTRTVLSFRDDRLLYFPELSRTAPRSFRRLPLHLYRSDDVDEAGRTVPSSVSIHLLDLESGELTRIAHLACGFSDSALSADGTLFAYETFRSCRDDGDGGLEGVGPVLNLKNLATGDGQRIDLEADDLESVRVSPGGERVLATTRNGDGSGGALAWDGVEGEAPREVDLRHSVDGVLTLPEAEPEWVDDRHLLLRYASARPSGATAATLVVFDVVEGTAVRVYRVPRAGWRLF